MLSRALMMTSLETLKISFALYIKLFGESVSMDIGTEGFATNTAYPIRPQSKPMAAPNTHRRTMAETLPMSHDLLAILFNSLRPCEASVKVVFSKTSNRSRIALTQFCGVVI